MNSKRLAVFAASVQWADAVKVMSRGTPRSRTSVTWGIRWSVSAAENDGESGGRFPTVRHAHLLGLIGRSHFPAQAQAEEREERMRLGRRMQFINEKMSKKDSLVYYKQNKLLMNWNARSYVM